MPCRTTLLCAALSAALAVGCSTPEVPLENGVPGTATEPRPIEADDVDVELQAQIGRVRATVTTAQQALADTRAAQTLPGAIAAAEQALGALLAQDDTSNSTSTESDTGLLPSRTTRRGDATVPSDLLTGTLTLAQDRGGDLGTRTAEVLRDPIAGDLGAWQRDAGGMVELARSTATSSTNLSVLERRVLELTGEGTRALAWTFVAAGADDLQRARAAAERAGSHLEIIEVALDELVPDPEATTS